MKEFLSDLGGSDLQMNVNIFVNINLITISGCIMPIVLNRAFNTEM